jgi:hypothetical protein
VIDLSEGALIHAACAIANRELMDAEWRLHGGTDVSRPSRCGG